MTGDATSALVRATRQRKRTLQATPGRSDHRPADLAATPLLPLRSRRRSGALATFLRYSSDRPHRLEPIGRDHPSSHGFP
jgi:hypothetical protein